MNLQNKIGICVECGYHLDSSAIDKAVESIYTFLELTGNISPSQKHSRKKQKRIHAHTIYHTKTDNFELAKEFADFEPVSKGQVIGHDGDEKVTAPEDEVIIFARNRDQKNSEAFILARIEN